MPIPSIPQKLLFFTLFIFSTVAYGQRPRWSSHTYGLIGIPYKVLVADVNGDGLSDLVIALEFSQEVAVLLGNANGTFQSPKYSVYDGGDIAVADFNGDHKADLATPSRLYRGSGDGYFHYASLLPKSGFIVLANNFNKDGKPDLDVIGSTTIWTLLGNGLGNFTPKATGYENPLNSITRGFSTDLNGDGIPDLLIKEDAISPGSDDSILVEIGKGDGTFTAVASRMEPAGVIGLGSVNGDKKLDLVVAGECADSSCQYVYTYFGKGDGTFEDGVYANINCAYGITLGDLNGDGRSDLLCVPDNSGASGPVTFYSSNGNGSYTKGTAFTGSNPYGIVIADLNRDGTKDAILLNVGSSVTVLLNLSGTSMAVTTTPSTLVYKQPFSVVTSVKASITQTPHPGGSVVYKNGIATLGSASVGAALQVAAGLAVGTHSATATYGGDGNFNPHTITVTKTVGKATSSTKLTSSANPSPHGHAVTLTATAAPQFAGVPGGKITFKNGSTVLATVTMASGKATLTTSSLGVGTHSITATYTGDGNFNSSTSPALSQKVN